MLQTLPQNSNRNAEPIEINIRVIYAGKKAKKSSSLDLEKMARQIVKYRFVQPLWRVRNVIANVAWLAGVKCISKRNIVVCRSGCE